MHWIPTCKLHQKRSKTLMIPSASHNDTTLVLRRTFTASRERVFRAWITPRALEHWFRPRGMSVTVRSLEARVGGSFRFDLENGGFIFGAFFPLLPPPKKGFFPSRETKQDPGNPPPPALLSPTGGPQQPPAPPPPR